MKHNYYDLPNDLVLVFSLNGQPLMPTTNRDKVTQLLKEKRARIVCKSPFAIQLLYQISKFPKAPPREFEWIYKNVDPRRLVKNSESAYRWYKPKKRFY